MAPPKLGAEDFAFFAQECPSLYVSMGVTPPDQDPTTAAPNHSPLFEADESALIVGVRTMAALAVDYMADAAR
jgi:amidohydrolase